MSFEPLRRAFLRIGRRRLIDRPKVTRQDLEIGQHTQ